MWEDWKSLIAEMRKGSVRGLARLITRVENRESGWMDAMQMIYPMTGNACVIGITGSPGAGKSTLTDRLARELFDRGFKIGIIAVDPSSPFSGGALLGDRLRMKEVSTLDDVFIRSMATHGALGGLNLSARDVVKIMDAFGKDIILIETVGVGQDEVEVVKAADMVLVVCVPGMGDGIQAIKAGIMEIADIFVVNKADQGEADQAVADISAMLELSSDETSSQIPVLKTIAATGEGVPDLVTIMLKLQKTGRIRSSWHEERIKEEILSLLEKEVAYILRSRWGQNGNLDQAVKQVTARKKDPYSIVQEMLALMQLQ
ncbi:MAG: methylmalonyl Co-A mutase-associated GTPase MeaB [Desulfobacterales bacterium CG23_combo_of_CG06-09_8_20_14_all_51_8]|nr:MAG: methylmalonyl Co-A mutase-associated GTPase MeaB [Desulfobacterales bacterium CG23_combo_of_CG06-09_8_20_14_all_51_8]